MRYDVFISYSSKDQKIVEGLSAYLEQHRVRCFVAYRDIPKGIAWAKAIVEALDDSRMMVVVFSDNFNRSEQVDREIEIASEDGKPILTFRVTGDQFKGAKKYYLKNLNWIDAFPEPEKQFGALAQNVMKLLGMQEPQPRQPETDAEEETTDTNEMVNRGYTYDTAHNYEEALKWYRKAAEKGNATAQYNAGVLYENGKGVAQDYAEAARWYRKAAEQGHAKAQYNLGGCYYNGLGVAEDKEKAVGWYRKAAEQGYASAQHNLGWCYLFGKGIAQSNAEAVKWFRKAAEQGDAPAQHNLGGCYYVGAGVEKDYNEAVRWIRKAAAQGHADAKKALAKITGKQAE